MLLRFVKNKMNNIFQTHKSIEYIKTKPKLSLSVKTWLRYTHNFKYHFYNDHMCKEFMKNIVGGDIYKAYQKLPIKVMKADLWRYCVLYIHGGIYMDIKLKCINGFRLIELTENNHYVKDRVAPLSIYNALMVCQKVSPCLWKSIYRVVFKVQNQRHLIVIYSTFMKSTYSTFFFKQPILNHFCFDKVRLEVVM